MTNILIGWGDSLIRRTSWSWKRMQGQLLWGKAKSDSTLGFPTMLRVKGKMEDSCGGCNQQGPTGPCLCWTLWSPGGSVWGGWDEAWQPAALPPSSSFSLLHAYTSRRELSAGYSSCRACLLPAVVPIMALSPLGKEPEIIFLLQLRTCVSHTWDQSITAQLVTRYDAHISSGFPHS